MILKKTLGRFKQMRNVDYKKRRNKKIILNAVASVKMHLHIIIRQLAITIIRIIN